MPTSASTSFAPEIRIEELLPDGRRYVLPRRDLGNARWLALPMVGGGLFISIAVLLWSIDAAGIRNGPAHPFGIVMAAFGIPGICMGLFVIAVALAMLFGHSEIEVRSGRLRTIERLGPLRWNRTRAQTVVRMLVVEGAQAENEANRRDPARSLMGNLAAIRIVWNGSKPWLAAIGYPHQILVPLAHDLAIKCRLESDLQFGTPQPASPPIEVVEHTQSNSIEQQLKQPSESKIVVNDEAGTVTFNILPRGLLRGSAGLFFFSILWCGFMVVFTTLSALSLAGGKQNQGPKDILFMSIIIALFWGIGIGIMLAAINMGRRRAGIVVTDSQLSVLQTGIFRAKERSWTKDQLSSIRSGNSSIEVNDVPLPELQIWPIEGKKFGLLVGHEADELKWLAARICQTLGVPNDAESAKIIVYDVDQQPTGSRVRYQALSDGLTLSIPRAGLRRMWGMWSFALFMLLFLAGMTAVLFFGGAFEESLFAAFVLGLFWCVAFFLIGLALHMTIHRAEIAMAADRLFVVQTGLLGAQRNEWSRDEIAAIRAGASQTKLGNTPLMQLQIVPKTSKQVALLTGRDERELAWLATLLRRALDVPIEEPPQGPATG